MDGTSNGGGLGKLLPKAMSVKRRRRKEGRGDTDGDDDDGGRGRSPASSRNASIPDSASTRSLTMADSDPSIGPIYESDQES